MIYKYIFRIYNLKMEIKFTLHIQNNMHTLYCFPGQRRSTPARRGVRWAVWWTRTRPWWRLLMGPRPAAHRANRGSRRDGFDRSGIVTTWVERTCIRRLTCLRVMVRDRAATHTYTYTLPLLTDYHLTIQSLKLGREGLSKLLHFVSIFLILSSDDFFLEKKAEFMISCDIRLVGDEPGLRRIDHRRLPHNACRLDLCRTWSRLAPTSCTRGQW